MRVIEIDREGDCSFRVTWMQGMQPKRSRLFDSRDAAESFAMSKIGARGSIVSTLDMTVEQLAAHKKRQARNAERLRDLEQLRVDERSESILFQQVGEP